MVPESSVRSREMTVQGENTSSLGCQQIFRQTARGDTVPMQNLVLRPLNSQSNSYTLLLGHSREQLEILQELWILKSHCESMLQLRLGCEDRGGMYSEHHFLHCSRKQDGRSLRWIHLADIKDSRMDIPATAKPLFNCVIISGVWITPAMPPPPEIVLQCYSWQKIMIYILTNGHEPLLVYSLIR